MRDRFGGLLAWVGWIGALGALTVAYLPFRDGIDPVYVTLSFLLVVLGGSATGGRALGLALTFIAYFGFHFFFVEAFDSLTMVNARDTFVLAAFLVTSLVASHLVTRARADAAAARARTSEVERLASIGAETLAAGRAEDALRAVIEVIRTTAGVDRGELIPDERAHTRHVQAHELHFPLTAHGQRAGTLVLSHHAEVHLTDAQRRFLTALAHYAALAAERVRLVADAEQAEASRQAEALRASLLAGLSHDLRTPLTTIKAIASRLRGRLPEAAAIEREADRLDRLAGDLVDLSRLNAGAVPIRAEVNAAADLVGAAVQRARDAHAADRLRVVPFDADGSPPVLAMFDFVHALRALSNLVENALKYSPPDSVVDLSVVRDEQTVSFSVADRGPGIAAHEAELVFDAFYRAPGAPMDTGGAGLGLAIARRLAREQDGDVTVTGRPGGGSVFTLTLPAASA